MRRLFAFITLALSLLVATIVGIPTITEHTNAGTEFDGGYSILYHVTDEGGIEYNGKALTTNVEKAVNNINDRLSLFGISNPDVSIEDNSYIRVTIPEVSKTKLDSVRYILQNSGKVTITNQYDEVLIADASKVFSSIKLSTVINDGTPTVYCSFEVEDAETLKSVTSNLASTYTADENSTTNNANFIVWLGYENEYVDEKAEFTGNEGDTFTLAQSDGYCFSKLITAIPVSSVISERFDVGSLISAENVNVINDILQSNPVKYVLNEVSTLKTGSYLDESVPQNSVIALFVAVAIIAAMFIVFYNLAGIASALSTIVYAIAVLAIYNLFGGLFGIETIIALLVGLVIAVGANVIFLERIKDEIRKGKTIVRSYEEGSKKSVSAILNCNVLVLIAALALYLFGNQIVKSFASVVIISQIVIMILVILLTRLMLSLLCHSSVFENKPKFFGVKQEEISDINNLEEYTAKNKFNKTNFLKGKKIKYLVSSAVVAAGLVIGLLFSIIGLGFFNGSVNNSSGTRICFRTVDAQFSTVEKVNEFFSSEDYANKQAAKVIITTEHITLDDSQITKLKNTGYEYELSAEQLTVYDVTVYYGNKLDETKMSSIDAYFEAEAKVFYDEDNDIKILKTFYSCNEFKSATASSAAISGIIALAAMIGFIFIYLVIRFSMSYAISSVAAVLHNELILFAILAIIRIPVGTEIVALGMAVAIITIANLVITFDELKENIKEATNVSWNKELRDQYVNEALQETMYGHLFSNGSAFVLILVTLLVGLFTSGVDLLSILVGMVISIIVSVYGSFGIMPYIWSKLEDFFSKIRMKRKEKRALKAKENTVDVGEPTEYTFFGVND